MSKEQINIGNYSFIPFINAQAIDEAIASVAARINKDYEGLNPMFICVLNGAFMFASDLLKKINIPCEIGFIRLSSYEGTQSTGNVKEIIGLTDPVAERHIIILEDIVDTGLTVSQLIEQLSNFKAASIEVATMLQKPDALEKDVKVKYTCIEIPNKFVIGYGLDLDGQARNLPEIYQIKE
jgi:hypoxanthine phosphoribosyltransferase